MKKIIIAFLLLCFSAKNYSQVVDPVNDTRATDPNQTIANALKATGGISLGVGVPSLIAGISCFIAANSIQNPLDIYTDSPTEAKNNEKLKYLSTKELADRVEEYNRTYNNLNMSGYILLPTGAALTIIGIPLIAFGNRIDLEIYMNNEIGAKIVF
jgi:hypothetical protein